MTNTPKRHTLAPRIAHTGRRRFTTEYGTIHTDPNAPSHLRISASNNQLWAWANRHNAKWPCSILSRLDRISVTLHSGDLVDYHTPNARMARNDLSGSELDAWMDDVLSLVMPEVKRLETLRERWAELRADGSTRMTWEQYRRCSI